MKVEQYSLGVKVSAVKCALAPDERLGIVTITAAVPTDGVPARLAHGFRHFAGATGAYNAEIRVAEHGFDCCASLIEVVGVAVTQRERDGRQRELGASCAQSEGVSAAGQRLQLGPTLKPDLFSSLLECQSSNEFRTKS